MNAKQNTPHKKEYLVDILHIFILVAFAVAQPLYDLLSRYADFFVVKRSKPVDVVLFALALSVGLPLVFGLFEIGVRRLFSDPFRRGLHLGLVGILTAAIVLPLLKRVRIFPQFLVWALTFLLALFVTLGYVRLKNLRTYLTFLLPSIVIFPLIFLFFSPISKIIFTQHDLVSPTEKGAAKEDNPPIVMVIYDEIATPYLMNEEKEIDAARYPNFASLASQAYWFRNTTTVVHATTWATPVILSGLYPSLDNPKLPSIVDYPNNLFTLMCHVYQLNAIESATEMCPAELNNIHLEGTAWMRRLGSLLSDTSIIYLHYLLPPSLTRSLPDISQNWGEFYKKKGEWMRGTKVKQKILEGRLKLHRKFLDSLSPSRIPNLYFLHILLPHPPVKFLPSGRTYGDHGYIGCRDERWGWNEWAVTSGFQRFLLQLQYVDRLLGEVLTRLKEVKLFDPSLIIVVADHGASYRLGGYRRNVTERNIGDIMPIPLFVKLPWQREGVVDDSSMETVDILPTIADLANVELPWSVDGHSVFNKAFPHRENKVILGQKKYVLSNSEFCEKFSESLTHMLTLFGSGKTKPDGLFRIGSYKNLLGESVNRFPILRRKSIKVGLKGTLPLFQDVRFDSGFLPCFIQGNIHTETPVHLAVGINGIICGVSEILPVKKDLAKFFTMVPEKAFKEGRNEVEVFVIREGADGGIELERTIIR
jgi:hypothetical protein